MATVIPPRSTDLPDSPSFNKSYNHAPLFFIFFFPRDLADASAEGRGGGRKQKDREAGGQGVFVKSVERSGFLLRAGL